MKQLNTLCQSCMNYIIIFFYVRICLIFELFCSKLRSIIIKYKNCPCLYANDVALKLQKFPQFFKLNETLNPAFRTKYEEKNVGERSRQKGREYNLTCELISKVRNSQKSVQYCFRAHIGSLNFKPQRQGTKDCIASSSFGKYKNLNNLQNATTNRRRIGFPVYTYK